MSKENFSNRSEFICLQHIATDTTNSLVNQLKEEWFFDLSNKYIFKLLKDNSGIDALHFIEKIGEERIHMIGMKSTTELFAGSSYDFQSAADIIREKYLQRLTEEKLKGVIDIIYDTDIDETETRVTKFFKELDRSSEKFRSLDSNFTSDTSQIIQFTERRLLNNLIPKRGSIMTIGGDSSHHKTNQLLDILIDALDCNYPINNNFKVLMFSGEEDFDDIRNRIFAKKLHIDHKLITKREIRPAEVLDLINEKCPYILTNFSLIGPDEFKNATDMARINNRFAPDVWGIDFIQYFAQTSAGNAAEQNRNVMEAIATMKILTEVGNNMCVALSQVRKSEKSAIIQFPKVNDLEWSGLIKQISRNIGMCFWPYKVKPAIAELRPFILSWQKVRYGDIFNEWLNVFPEYCDFEVMHSSVINKYKTYLQW